MNEAHRDARTRPPPAGVDTQLTTTLSNALISTPDALSAMHGHKLGLSSARQWAPVPPTTAFTGFSTSFIASGAA